MYNRQYYGRGKLDVGMIRTPQWPCAGSRGGQAQAVAQRPQRPPLRPHSQTQQSSDQVHGSGPCQWKLSKVWSRSEEDSQEEARDGSECCTTARRSRPNIVPRQPSGPGFLSRGHCDPVEVPRQRQGNLTAQKLHAETQVLNEYICDNLSEDQVPVSCRELPDSN